MRLRSFSAAAPELQVTRANRNARPCGGVHRAERAAQHHGTSVARRLRSELHGRDEARALDALATETPMLDSPKRLLRFAGRTFAVTLVAGWATACSESFSPEGPSANATSG